VTTPTRAPGRMAARLILLALGLIALHAVVIGVARAAGASQSGPLAAWFAGPEGEACDPLCLLGVRPGLGVLDAVEQLTSHPMVGGLRTNRALFGTTLSSATLRIDLHRARVFETVGYIHIAGRAEASGEVPALPFTIGDVIATLGAPDGFQTGRISGESSLMYRTAGQTWLLISAQAPHSQAQRINLADRVRSLTLITTDRLIVDPTAPFRWLGFSATRRHPGSLDTLP
jgi:hypothetical protein